MRTFWEHLKRASPAAGARRLLGGRSPVPVRPGSQESRLQLSIDENQPASFHHDVGQRLAPLREEGILIIGSGNLVHNLHAYAWGQHTAEPYDWAVLFERRVRELLLSGETKPLVGYENKLG